MLPVFKRSEDYHGGANAFHGAGGEWRVEKQRLKWKILETFAQAAQEQGIPATSDFNRGNNEGVGYFDVNQKRGVRWNASKAFLRAAMKRPNLTVVTGALTERVIFEGKRCVGVEYRGDVPYRARARCEVILCSGAVNSPQLLERSGIGQAARLAQLRLLQLKLAVGLAQLVALLAHGLVQVAVLDRAVVLPAEAEQQQAEQAESAAEPA